MRALIFALVIILPGAVSAQQEAALSAFQRALEAQVGGDAAAADVLAVPLGAVARDLLLWERLRNLPDAPPAPGDETAPLPALAAVTALLDRRPDWPGAERIRSRAETWLVPEAAPVELMAFFADRTPATASGAERLSRALVAAGKDNDAQAMLIAVWRNAPLDEKGEAALLAQHADLLAPHHHARAIAALDADRLAVAERILPRLPEPHRGSLSARLAYRAGRADAPEAEAALPEAARADPALAAARFNWLAARGSYTEAVALLALRSSSAEALGRAQDWARWRARLARWVMRQGDAVLAHKLASNHFLTPDADPAGYADLEWLAGYIALTHLAAPDVAGDHFAAMGQVVVTPISLARSWFWLGEAHAEAGDAPAAQAAWRAASRYQGVFYGQLAAARLDLPLDAALMARPEPVDWRAIRAEDDMLQAFDLLLGAGEVAEARRFAAAIGSARSALVIRAGAAMALEREAWTAALWLGKSAARRGIILPEALFPDHPLGAEELPVEPALALSVARQESEFRVDAGSSAGALGLMQILPGTARQMAAATGRDYSHGALFTSWRYNAALGSAYLAHLIEEFGDSPVLIAVAYNAGPGRARDWIAERGDPRDPLVDPVDWIEHIPFEETRNYVMRVTEAMPVYRGRSAGRVQPFDALLNGAMPLRRPMARPDGLRAGSGP